ncbi:hypothetical protein VNO80_16564 [Phaseolus coccineus]|uniref:Uncharacterized protein n=1 Tax=Phaseolus coccineus TaxID=3886 RepID=A0AAN9MM88_PHACN
MNGLGGTNAIKTSALPPSLLSFTEVQRIFTARQYGEQKLVTATWTKELSSGRYSQRRLLVTLTLRGDSVEEGSCKDALGHSRWCGVEVAWRHYSTISSMKRIQHIN